MDAITSKFVSEKLIRVSIGLEKPMNKFLRILGRVDDLEK